MRRIMNAITSQKGTNVITWLLFCLVIYAITRGDFGSAGRHTEATTNRSGSTSATVNMKEVISTPIPPTQIVIAVVACLAFILSLINYGIANEKRMDDLTADLVRSYFHHDFARIRHTVWRKVYKDCWNVRHRSGEFESRAVIAHYFYPDFDEVRIGKEHLLPKYDHNSAHQMTALQAMVYFLSFWETLVAFHKKELIDENVILPLRYQYACWKPFLTELAKEVTTVAGGLEVPRWAASITDLDGIFQNVVVHEHPPTTVCVYSSEITSTQDEFSEDDLMKAYRSGNSSPSSSLTALPSEHASGL